jgi:hypothetical protein
MSCYEGYARIRPGIMIVARLRFYPRQAENEGMKG